MILRNKEISAATSDCQVYDWKAEKRRLLMCEPSILATNVTILADEADSLSLCEVLITATGKNRVTRDVTGKSERKSDLVALFQEFFTISTYFLQTRKQLFMESARNFGIKYVWER